MKKYLRIIFILAIISCGKEKITTPVDLQKVITIEYEDRNRLWSEQYDYDAEGHVRQIQIDQIVYTRHNVEYSNEKLLAYNTFQGPDTIKVSKDSFVYNENDRLEKILQYAIESNGNLELRWTSEFEYDAFGKVKKQSYYYNKSESYIGFAEYTWKNGNIVKQTSLNAEKELQYEFFYTYDNKVNYLKKLPNYQRDPLNWGKNNVTKMTYKDYYGNLDLICGPCEQTYTYSLSGYPLNVEYNWGRKLTVTYE